MDRYDEPHPDQRCSNCDAALNGAYCHACGQAAHLHRSLLHLTEELLHGVAHFDAKGWRTLPLLIARPGLLTRRYIDGQRTRYVSPLALFLFTVFLIFFVYSMTAGEAPATPLTVAQRTAVAAELRQSGAESKAELDRATTILAEARRTHTDERDAEIEAAVARSTQRITDRTVGTIHAALPSASGGTPAVSDTWKTQLAALDVHTGLAWLDARLHHQLSNPDLFLYKLKNTAYKFSFMLIPISLPFLWLMFVGRPGIAVYDHAVFALYSLSFMSLLFASATLLATIGMASVASFLVIGIPPIHMFAQLRETYRLRTGAALWRTIVLLGVAGSCFALFLVFITLVILH
jgi:hypothetical protein